MSAIMTLLLTPLTTLMQMEHFTLVLGSCLMLAFVIWLVATIIKVVF